ncbi:unnamed protein product [Brachionus calyciflorus]|uniref:Uncharacterized protein n=1 Tax=Brachionus calyciflorus TaxID=104777 RepID=A0A813S1I7_9BILA|nr:unnamed protein product [Brachionus calyciflorus]
MYNYRPIQPSLDEEFDFLRPNAPPPLPYSQSPSLKYHQNIYHQISQSPRLENSTLQQTPNLSLNETISQSVMFGIPRNNYPRPTDIKPSVGIDIHRNNLGNPFVDITLNNCDDLSLYQPIQQLSVRHPTPLKNSQVRPQIYAPQQLAVPKQNTQLENISQQHSNHIVESPKPILKKLPEQVWSSNGPGVYNQNLYKDGSSLFKIDDNLDADEEEDDDEESDENDETENIFSAALKNLKEKSNDWNVTNQSKINHNSQSNLPKFEYKSLLLDDIDSFVSNNNMSMNTRALAAKYLNKKESGSALEINSQSLCLPQLDTQNLFKLYTPKESFIQDNVLKNSNNSNSSNNNSSESDDSDEDIWLFGKPVDGNSGKKKPKQKQQKDFSDQDSDVDRDVTNVLDIQKLKLLPKLL